MKKKKNKNLANKLAKHIMKDKLSLAFTTLNIVLLILNIFIGGYNIVKTNKEMKALDYDATKMRIDLIKEYPLFEVQYIEASFHTLESMVNENDKTIDSLYSNPFKNYNLVKNDVYNDLYNRGDSPATVALAIKQIGGGVAKDVEIEFCNIASLEGISYSFSAGDDIASLINTETDIAGNKIKQKKCRIKYGDIHTGRGLIIPLLALEYCNSDTTQYDYNGDEIWSITNHNIFIPIKLYFRNIYDNTIKEGVIRNMNNSIISTYWDIDIRG